MSKDCKDCKWWSVDLPKEQRQGLVIIQLPASDTYNPAVARFCWSPNLREDYRPMLTTLTFGCDQFEPKVDQ